MAKKNDEQIPKGNQRSKWFFIIGFLLFLWIISMVIAGGISLYFGGNNEIETPVGKGNVAVISIKGIINTEKNDNFFSSQSASSDRIVEFIKAADKDSGIKAIIFDINSPGGSPVASEEIAFAMKQSKKLKVAVIRDIGTSGAYWAASAADIVVASKMSITGSIGVISSYLEFQGTMDKYGVTYERLVAGKYKDMGSPFRNMTDEERELFQTKLDKMHQYFMDEVAQNRNLTSQEILKVSQGDFFTGAEAKDLKLVDVLGNKDDAVKIIEQRLNTTVKIVEYKEKQGFWSSIVSSLSKPAFYAGQGVGYAIKDTKLEDSVNIRS